MKSIDATAFGALSTITGDTIDLHRFRSPNKGKPHRFTLDQRAHSDATVTGVVKLQGRIYGGTWDTLGSGALNGSGLVFYIVNKSVDEIRAKIDSIANINNGANTVTVTVDVGGY